MVFEAIPLHARGRVPGMFLEMHFLNVFFVRCPGGVPRSVSKICLSNFCFSLVVCQLLFCNCVLEFVC